MTKVDKELISQIEEAIKDLENITCDDPGPPLEYQEIRHKNAKKYVEKLMKGYREKQIKKGSVDKLKL